MPIVIPWEELHKFSKEALLKLSTERSHALHELNKGHDLPGVWPHFYLYADYSWSVGYSPTGEFISSVMADGYTEDTFIDHIEMGLKVTHDIGPRPKYVPKPKTEPKPVYHYIDPLSIDEHVKEDIEHKTKADEEIHKHEEEIVKPRRGRPPNPNKDKAKDKPKERTKLKDKPKKRTKKTKAVW